VELQTLANRTLPAATEAFLEHLKGMMEAGKP